MHLFGFHYKDSFRIQMCLVLMFLMHYKSAFSCFFLSFFLFFTKLKRRIWIGLERCTFDTKFCLRNWNGDSQILGHTYSHPHKLHINTRSVILSFSRRNVRLKLVELEDYFRYERYAAFAKILLFVSPRHFVIPCSPSASCEEYQLWRRARGDARVLAESINS